MTWPTKQITVAGVTIKADNLKDEDYNLLKKDISNYVFQEKEPTVAQLIADNIDNIAATVALVNANTSQGYKGMNAEGKQVDLQGMRAKDIIGQDSWTSSVTAGSATTWIDKTGANELPENEAHVILGFYDPIDVPKIDAVKIKKGTETYPSQTLPLNVRKTFGTETSPVIRLKNVLVVPPKGTYSIDYYPNITGNDKLQPIGFRAVTAEALTKL